MNARLTPQSHWLLRLTRSKTEIFKPLSLRGAFEKSGGARVQRLYAAGVRVLRFS